MEKKRTKVVASVLALAALVVFSLTAGGGSLEPAAAPGPTMKTLDEVEPRVPIRASDLPLTITEPNSYYLVEDISFADTLNHAITIECNDVTIDLMGYTLKGPDSGAKSGIYMDGRTNVEVRDGTVRDFLYGIHETSAFGKQHRLVNIRTISNQTYGIRLNGYGHLVKDCTAAENGHYGIYAYRGSTVGGAIACDNGLLGICTDDGSTVTGNTAYENDGYGIYTGGGCTVNGNTAYGNNDTGIYTGAGCTVTANTSYSNNGNGSTTFGHGIYAGNGSTVTGNTLNYNFGDGIKVDHYCRVIANTCNVNGNAGDGAGIHATGLRNRIEQNSVTNNDRGIDVDLNDNLIVRNNAAANTTGYDVVAGNKLGQVSNDPNTAGPWYNFDF